LTTAYPIVSAVEAYKLTADCLNPISYSNTEDIDVLKEKNKLMSGCVAYNYYNYSLYQRAPNPPGFFTGASLGGTMFAFDLQRNSNVNLSGLSTNANKVITIEVNGLAAFSKYKVYASVQYATVAQVYENNVVISK
jgi:hypothetical protein